MPWVVRYTQGTRMARLAVDPEPGDQIEEVAGRVARKPHEPRPVYVAEVTLNLVRLVLEPGIDLPAITTGGAPAGLVSLEQRHRDAALGEVQCR
jgi:hypothetical protein